ncbi:hypothetical protein IV203_013282 [Nitzschia inconspicua]|uniref:Uncharacterized protein n=1 Tax=Nitzschia inconspicua TaxID=303405 RepID=A0A9K3Q7C8_9STRA|nr:hypothetical protein IV203_013282 [Nitzschia inconspicua]
MRFSVTSFLAVAGSAAALESSGNTVNDSENIEIIQHEQRRAVLQTFLGGDGLSKQNKRKSLLQQQMKYESKIHSLNQLKNGNGPVPCLPPQSPDDLHSTQDFLGILSCGEGEYCAESDISYLGGFCEQQRDGEDFLDRRRLQYCWDVALYCSSEEAVVDYCADYDTVLPTCDCGDFDAAQDTGTIYCQVPNRCIEERPIPGFAPCEPTCFDTVRTSTYSPTFESSITCTIFTEPYTQSLCFGYSQTIGDTGLPVETSCNISLDGVYCDSCSVATFEGTPQTNPNFFDTWDCNNVGLGASPTDGSVATRLLLNAPLLTGDPDCSKTDSPTVMSRSPSPSPLATGRVEDGTAAMPTPSAAGVTQRGTVIATIANFFGATLWSIAASYGA